MEQKGRPYSVVRYDPKWKDKYTKEKRIIAGIFGKKALEIEHIGSTSVEGMWAKPQIDILVLVNDLRVVNKKITNEMESKGYIFQKNYLKDKDQKYFAKDAPTGERLVSVHVAKKGSPHAARGIYFRDYLRSHQKEREDYSKVKREAYENGVDRAEYPMRKRKILNIILKKAKKEFSQNAKTY